MDKGVSPRDQVDEIRFGLTYEDAIGLGGSVTDDYSLWAGGFLPGDDIGAAGDDYDGDSLTNDEERLWGLDPTSGSSVHPISTGLDATAGTLSYTRRDTDLSGAGYSYQWSTTLADGEWNDFIPTSEITDNGSPVETVTIALDAGLLANPALFVRVVATAG
jgi:hypothetical protein